MMLLRHKTRMNSTARIIVVFLVTCSVMTSGQICEQDELTDTALKNLEELSQLGIGRFINSLNSVTTPEDCFSLCCQSHESDGCNVATFTAYEGQSQCVLVSCQQPISDCLQTSALGSSTAIIRLSTDLVTQSPSAVPSIDDVKIDGEDVPLTEQETSGDDQEVPVTGTSTDSTIVNAENIDEEIEIGSGDEEKPLVSEGEHVEAENQAQPYQQQETYARLAVEQHIDPLANTGIPENNMESTQDLAGNNNQGEEPSVVVVTPGGEQQQQSSADNEQHQYAGDAVEEAGNEDLPRDANNVDGAPLNDQEQLAEDSSHPDLPASDGEQSLVNDLEQLLLNNEQSAASDNEQQAYVSNNYVSPPALVDNSADEDNEEPSVIDDGEQFFITSNEETVPATSNNEQQSANNEEEQAPVSNEEEQAPVSNEEEQAPVSNEEEQPPVSNEEEQPPVSNDDAPLSNNEEQGLNDEQLVVSNEEQSFEQLDGSNNDDGTVAAEETDRDKSEDDVALNKDTSVSGHFHANDVKSADSSSRDASMFESFYVAMVTVTIAVMLVVMLIIIVRRIQRARRLHDYKKLAPHYK